MTKSPTPEYYQRRVGGVLLDPYRIARVYGMTDDALFSALKKILAAGKRGAKDKAKDVQDAIDALVRWQEMEAEDNADSRVAAMDAADSHDTSVVPLVLDIATILEFREGNHVVDEAARVAAHIAELEALVQSVTSALPPQVLDDVPLALPDRVANLVDDLRTARRRIAELERARDDARTLLQNARDQRDSYRDTLDTERQAAAATAEELERVRKELGAQSQRAADAEAAFRKERTRADALHGELSTARHDLTALSGTYHAEMDFRIEMRRELGANDGEGFPDFLRRVCRELAALRDRYRSRRQVEEPAPENERVLACATGAKRPSWRRAWGCQVGTDETWTHQPPAPGEGEA